MIDGKDLVKSEDCHGCGCNLKPACPGYWDETENNKMKVRVSRVHENAKLPVRAHPTDAGMDLFFCPPPKPELDSQIERCSPLAHP